MTSLHSRASELLRRMQFAYDASLFTQPALACTKAMSEISSVARFFKNNPKIPGAAGIAASCSDAVRQIQDIQIAIGRAQKSSGAA